MVKISIEQVRKATEPLRFGFLAARAMPDGALAVAIYLGDDHVQVMRLYMNSINQSISLGYRREPVLGRDMRLPSPWDNRHDVNMDFSACDVIMMTRTEFDECTYHQKIPQYKELPAYQPQTLVLPSVESGP